MQIRPSAALRMIHRRFPLSRTTFYRWLEEDRIPVQRFGSRLYIEHTDVLKFLDSNQALLRCEND